MAVVPILPTMKEPSVVQQTEGSRGVRSLNFQTIPLVPLAKQEGKARWQAVSEVFLQVDLYALLIKILQTQPLIRRVEATIMAVRRTLRVKIPHSTIILNVLTSPTVALVADAVGIKKGPPAHQVLQMAGAGILSLMLRVV